VTADQLLAAEYALGLLEGEDLLAARARESADPAFARDVAEWPDPAAERIAQAPMTATMPIGGTPLNLDFTYLPDDRSLLVGAVGLEADGVHDHEIWFVPPEGELVSLGVVTPGEVVAHSVPESVARTLHDGSQLLLTREPLGGKPEDSAAGPVVAEAEFATI
jgi:anti-sigma-K factor RskA